MEAQREDVLIRPAQAGDLGALLDIYNYYVLNTAITFDLEPVTLARGPARRDGNFAS